MRLRHGKGPRVNGPGTHVPTYFALIGDIVDSRVLPDRSAVQHTLSDGIQRLNRKCHAEMAAPLRIIDGDAVQVLLVSASPVVDIVSDLEDALHPAAMVWGLGRGELSTDFSQDVATIDGPCFHHARAAVEDARSKPAWLRVGGIAPIHASAVSAAFTALWAIRSRWTDTQRRYVDGARSSLQQTVAARHGVSKQAVSKSLDTARYAALLEIESGTRDLLEWIAGRPAGEEDS